MFKSFIKWIRGKHAPTGKTEMIIDILETDKAWADSKGTYGEIGGYNQSALAFLIGEPEYVLRGMMDVLVDLNYVHMEKRGNAKVYYLV